MQIAFTRVLHVASFHTVRERTIASVIDDNGHGLTVGREDSFKVRRPMERRNKSSNNLFAGVKGIENGNAKGCQRVANVHDAFAGFKAQ